MGQQLRWLKTENMPAMMQSARSLGVCVPLAAEAYGCWGVLFMSMQKPCIWPRKVMSKYPCAQKLDSIREYLTMSRHRLLIPPKMHEKRETMQNLSELLTAPCMSVSSAAYNKEFKYNTSDYNKAG